MNILVEATVRGGQLSGEGNCPSGVISGGGGIIQGVTWGAIVLGAIVSGELKGAFVWGGIVLDLFLKVCTFSHGDLSKI